MADTYTYPTTSNKLSSVTLGGGGSRVFTYDGMGSVTNEARTSSGAYSYTYDNAGRMATFSIGGVLQAIYKYDFAGRQVVRALTSPTAVTIHSVFDSDGNRIAEYNEATGALIREYVWLNGEPLAVIEGGVVNFVRVDHIGRPVFATNSSGVKTWTASYLPFGEVRTTSGTPIALRFPGQWFQSESGLHQNWMRDYDSTTGRYLEADPLGLVDGASVYGYVKGNPGRWVDPMGLASNSDPMDPNSEFCKNLKRKIDNLGREVRRRDEEMKIGGLPQNFAGAQWRETMAGHRYLRKMAWLRYLDALDEYFKRCGGGQCIPVEEEPSTVPIPRMPWTRVPMLSSPGGAYGNFGGYGFGGGMVGGGGPNFR